MKREYLILGKSRAKPKRNSRKRSIENHGSGAITERQHVHNARWYNRFERTLGKTVCCVQTNQTNLPFLKRGDIRVPVPIQQQGGRHARGEVCIPATQFSYPVALLPHLLRSFWPILPLLLGSRPFFSSFQTLTRMCLSQKACWIDLTVATKLTYINGWGNEVDWVGLLLSALLLKNHTWMTFTDETS